MSLSEKSLKVIAAETLSGQFYHNLDAEDPALILKEGIGIPSDIIIKAGSKLGVQIDHIRDGFDISGESDRVEVRGAENIKKLADAEVGFSGRR